MTDSEPNVDSAVASRRALLKGAVGAGVGLAAWNAPKIGTIPAYALTNSTGVFNNVCYYIVWAAGVAQRWGRGPAVAGAGKDTGRPDSVVLSGNFDAVYTWNDVFGPGQDLVVTVSGSPQPHDGGRLNGQGTQHNQRDHVVPGFYPNGATTTEPATITLTQAPASCVFEDRGLGVTYDGPPGPNCTLPATVRLGWASESVGGGPLATAEVILGPTSGTITNVRDGQGANYIIFNIDCTQ